MLKRVLFVSTVAGALLLTGCAKSSQVDPKEADGAVTETSRVAGSEQEAKVDQVAEDVAQAQQSAEQSGSDAAVGAADAISSQFPVVYFDFDRYDIRSDMQDAINKIATAVKLGDNKVKFRIEGNCDEWGTEEYNYALGLSRAKSVQDALVRAGVSKEQLSLISYGESNPVCKESKRECWQQNRRVEITILP